MRDFLDFFYVLLITILILYFTGYITCNLVESNHVVMEVTDEDEVIMHMDLIFNKTVEE